MIDANLVAFMVRSAGIRPGDRVLEIGTGTGLLTQVLLDEGAEVFTVEVDSALHTLVAPRLRPSAAVHAILADVLESKNRLCTRITEVMEGWGAGAYVVVSNLPYNVSVPAIMGLLRSRARPRRMVVTVQKEVADRFLAAPGRAAYGRVTVEARLRGDVKRLRVVRPEVFWPRPEVTSAVLEFAPFPDGMQPKPDDEPAFLEFLGLIFRHRRKQLGAALRRVNPAVTPPLEDLGLKPSVRAESLEPETLLRLHAAIRGRL
jgi:16S rRNA (adenine1518-N6/adenine1519-N6)-dimethyltransferase